VYLEQVAPGSVPKRSKQFPLRARSWKRAFAILSFAIFAIAAVAWLAIELWRGPSAENILAKIDTLPSPVLSPVEEQKTFRTAPGFRVELVAAEPLVVDPIAMDWDDEGGFMRSLDAKDEDLPSGRIVVLEDLDHDGRMDTSKVFLDGLVLPRGIAVLPQGVLIGAPPNLLLCQDNNANLVCEENEKTRLTHYAEGPGNVEHAEIVDSGE